MENTVKQVNILSKEFYKEVEKIDSSKKFPERVEIVKEQLTQTAAPTTVPDTGGSDQSAGQPQEGSNVETTE